MPITKPQSTGYIDSLYSEITLLRFSRGNIALGGLEQEA